MTSIQHLANPTAVRRPLVLAAGAVLLLAAIALSGAGAAHAILLLVAATLVSEDLTCIAAGQLVHRGEMSAAVAVIGCLVGIFIGDIGLWLAGRFLKPALRYPTEWKSASIPRLILLARFIPGVRLPMYISMGATGVDLIRFSVWALVGAIGWTPLLVLLVANLGDAIAAPIEAYLGSGWISLLAAIIAGMLLIQSLPLLFTEIGRARLIARVSKVWRWEFWPGWLFYLPLLPYIAWLSIRHRGFLTITAANPGIPHGGFVGESKFHILCSLDSPHVSPTAIVRDPARLERVVHERKWEFPLVLKPDAGQRGAGVKLCRSPADACEYLRANPGPTLIQPYHPGPYEAGVFYYRMPDESRGRILSITDKRFSQIRGDGRSTLEQLIWRHPRYRMQAGVFLARHARQAHRVLADGESLPLAMAGNHCQGTLFRDGSHLITPELERKVDQIARTFDGFYFGRFDVRYSDVERFKSADDFTIIELNGITSESTNLYDPDWSLLRAYRQLFRQWSILFQIGAANRTLGYDRSRFMHFLRDVVQFYRTREAPLLAD